MTTTPTTGHRTPDRNAATTPPQPLISPPLVHPTAEVEPGASVGAGTRIWHHAQVRAGAVIGLQCVLGKNVFVDDGVVVGDLVKIQNNVSLYRGVQLADEVFVGPAAVFTNDLRPRATGPWQVLATKVHQGASIGANATIVCGIEIGERAMVGAGAVVTRPVLPHQLVAGNPARPRGWVCGCGTVISRAATPPARLDCDSCATDAANPPARKRNRIRMGMPQLGTEEESAVLAVIRSGRLTCGPRVEEFERAFAAAHGAANAVAVSNGTMALVAALRAHGISTGDEVITSPLTFAGTLSALLEAGTTVRFADIGDDFLLDPGAVAAAITPRTRAVMPVHLYGLPADMTAITELAEQHRITVIADAAQAHGALVAGRSVGAASTAAFSLYGSKNITCGEGGVVTTTDDEVADRLRLIRNHGMRGRYEHLMPGSNYRLTELQAAIATVQLGRLPEINRRRAAHAAQLTAGLADLPGLITPRQPADRLHAWHQYTVRLTGEAQIGRDALITALERDDIEASVFYPRLVFDYDCYREHPRIVRDAVPRAELASTQVLSLPVHPGLTTADLDRVVISVRRALGG
ncbi:dTDP-4-amino-4,6-dideoxygalactose transaminase [Streptomyces sp. 846.5]|nr:aminotransferase class V-fold PLP-dependent enzyme [Streptomyces sp. 846.5]TDU03446.1 dTDP-4-amino-4,6-dideoxygalactose transaminase [Streptomyces sp. 846.5]